MFFIAVSILLAEAYLWLQLYYVYHWSKIPAIVVPETYEPLKGVSIIVVARNEEKSIEACITSILQQQYPAHLIDLIIIDDRSADQTSVIVSRIQNSSLRLFHLVEFPDFIHSPAFKKSGIELGVHLAKHDMMVVTDADCIHHHQWLRTVSYTQEKSNAEFLTGPIEIQGRKSLIIKMQQMENLALMLITAAGIRSRMHDIANGANMSFSKKSFQEVDPYKDNYHFASGDDMFLIEKIRKYFTDRIEFIKSSTAIVKTHGKEDWKSLIKQRIRWTGKNRGLQSPAINNIWMFVGFYHLLMLILLIAGLFMPGGLMSFLILLMVKWIADYMVIHTASRFFNSGTNPLEFILLQFMYLYYVLRLGWNLTLGRKGDW